MANNKQERHDDFTYYASFFGQKDINAVHQKRISISDEIARKKKLENDDREQDIKLKKKTLIFLLILLIVENVAIFIIAFFQGFDDFPFYLDSVSFNILTTATIAQIASMAHSAIKYLFPSRKSQ